MAEVGTNQTDCGSVQVSPFVNPQTNAAEEVTGISATLSGSVDFRGVDEVTAWFEYGLAERGSEMTETQKVTLQEPGEFEQLVDQLDSGTTYRFRVHARHEPSDTERVSNAQTFTAQNSSVRVETLEPTDVTSDAATFRANVTKAQAQNPQVFWHLRIGNQGESDFVTDVLDVSGTGQVELRVDGLEFGTRYKVQAVIRTEERDSEGEPVFQFRGDELPLIPSGPNPGTPPDSDEGAGLSVGPIDIPSFAAGLGAGFTADEADLL
jgi:hypothetical protein